MSDPNVSPRLLSECLIESDAEAIQRARRLRRKALALSLVIEAAVLAGLLAWPLLNPSTLNAHYISTPVPPYRPGPPEMPRHEPLRSITHPRAIRPVLMQPVVIPSQIDRRPEPPPAIEPEDFSANDSIGIGHGITGGEDGLSELSDAPAPPRPPKPHPAKPQPMSEVVMEARLVYRVQPGYPAIALAMRLSGQVRLRALISADGRVRELSLLAGNPILARAAIAAVAEWRYRPTLLNGRPVEVETLITVNFVLE
ncbi:MAG TPA: energy transducer TonB [Verrucomicrobiae bacterium]|nr:energy transducer TonB [Verrucomicrobiae bacterium]